MGRGLRRRDVRAGSNAAEGRGLIRRRGGSKVPIFIVRRGLVLSVPAAGANLRGTELRDYRVVRRRIRRPEARGIEPICLRRKNSKRPKLRD